MSAEFLCVVRRGLFARPNAEEKLEYLLSRVPRREGRKDFELHALHDATRHDDEIPQIPRGELNDFVSRFDYRFVVRSGGLGFRARVEFPAQSPRH